MASKIDQLRSAYTTLPTLEQKKKFILNIDQQLKKQGSTNKAYKSFLNECIRAYNDEVGGSNAEAKKASRSFSYTPQKSTIKSKPQKIIRILLIGLAIAGLAFVVTQVIGVVLEAIGWIIGVAAFIVIMIFFNFIDSIFSGDSPEPIIIETTNNKLIPKRVRVYGTWYDVSEGWAGTLELSEFMKKPVYFAKETATNDVFFVYAADENNKISEIKIGEFDMNYMSYKGSVTGVE